MRVFRIDPLTDPRWTQLLERSPQSSVFHTPAWMEALRRTYGYRPEVFTTCPPGEELTCGISFCDVKTWLTRRRLVSLPFSDHCNPLFDRPEELVGLLATLQDVFESGKWQYIEIRPRGGLTPRPIGFEKAKVFHFHSLDLQPSLDELYQGFHKDCVQRKIQRADREGLTYEEGRSDSLLDKFYRLLLLTRRRQGLPPQPICWFRNLIACLGDKLKIHVASKDGFPVASILTLRHKQVLVYKYGCSDQRSQKLGGTQLLFWKAIQEAKANRFREFDMGRSDWDNWGLVTFKDRWGGARSVQINWRHSQSSEQKLGEQWALRIVRPVFGHMPGSLLATAGALIYRHIG